MEGIIVCHVWDDGRRETRCLCNSQRGTSRTDPKPQLIASAIASFYQNNLHRWPTNDGLQVIPGIIMVGAVPIFYRIPITAELVRCVRAERYPVGTTRVQRCVPPVPNQSAYPEEELVPSG
ncbi:hypothetical protein EDB83DRAFT_767575 [Lactarius deliciosus]|nr:hypothetical protein EDB83DRAFT_767575 [Lactarius deliciosus]